MIEIIYSILDVFKVVSDTSTQYLGMDIFMIFPVFLIVEIISKALNIREKYPNHKTLIITLMNLATSFCIVFLIQDFQSFKDYMTVSLYLSSVTSFSCSFWKGLYKLLYERFVSRIGGEG